MNSNQSTDRPDPTPPQRRRGTTLAILLGATVLVAVAGTATGFWGHRHGFHGGDFDDEKLRFAVEWVLRGADASTEQVEAITAIADSAHSEIADLAASHRDNRAAFLAAFSADPIDPEAIEALRRDTLVIADAASTRLAAALVAMAQELSPEQRLELAERFEAFHAEHQGQHHGWHGAE